MAEPRPQPGLPVSEHPDSSTLLGIDPGLLRTGYALLAPEGRGDGGRVIEAGVIRLQRCGTLVARLVELEVNLQGIIESHRPAALCCEQLYAHYKHPRTAILMAHARGVILALAARSGMEVTSVSATNVKKLLTGSGKAGKRQVQLAVMATLRLPTVPEPHDVADALAIALAGLRLRAAAVLEIAPRGQSAGNPRVSTAAKGRQP